MSFVAVVVDREEVEESGFMEVQEEKPASHSSMEDHVITTCSHVTTSDDHVISSTSDDARSKVQIM